MVTEKKAKVNVSGQNNIVNVNSTLMLTTAVEEITKLLQKGDTFEAMQLLQRLGRAAAGQHPMYPHWKYDLQMGPGGDTSLSHVPASPESAREYPLKGKVTLVVPDEYKVFGSMEALLKHSYGKQMPLEFDATAVQIMIGDHIIEDLETTEDQKFKFVLTPHKFPEPKPFKLHFINDSFSIDYLLMQITEVDGSVLTFSNKGQMNAKVFVTLKLDVETQSGDFNIEIPSKYMHDVEAHYMLNKFILTTLDGDRFALKSLDLHTNLFQADNWNIKSEVNRESLKGFVDLLHTLLKLESFYNVKFFLPTSFTQDDMDAVAILRLASEGKSVYGTFSNLAFTTNDRDTVQRAIEIGESHPDGVKLDLTEYEYVINLLGATVTFDIERSFNNVVVADLDRLKRKYETMDPGDSIEVRYVPGSTNEATEKYIHRP